MGADRVEPGAGCNGTAASPLGVLAMAALLFGLAPLRIALAADPTLALKTSAATPAPMQAVRAPAGSLWLLQMTLCVVLLVAAGLLIRTLRNLENTPLGLKVDGLVVFGVKPTSSRSARPGVLSELIDKLRDLPGVESVTVMEERLGQGGPTTAT